jgi:hypothetical protein
MPDILLVLSRLMTEIQPGTASSAWLARYARPLSRQAMSDTEMFGLLGLPCDAPAGPITALGAGLDAALGHWCLARPLHLRADLSSLLLFGPASLAMNDAEAQSLADAFNAHFVDQGLSLHPCSEQGWLVHSRTDVGPGLGPVDAANPDLRSLGLAARPWQALLMEIQMLFHGHGVNVERQRQQRPIINGLWPEGCGALPAVQAGAPWIEALVAEGDWAKGLAMLSGLPLAPLASEMDQGQLWYLSEPCDVLDVLHRAQTWQAKAKGREVWVLHQGSGWRFKPSGWQAWLADFQRFLSAKDG